MDDIKTRMANDLFARHAGLELVSLEPGRATVRMLLQPFHRNGLGGVHGGAIFTLADFAFAAASNSHGPLAVAINVSITFLKAATTGVLVAEAREIALNPKLGTYTVEVKDEQGNLVALFQGLAYRKTDSAAKSAPVRQVGEFASDQPPVSRSGQP
jgi:acyl-CoA thioesterase